MIITKNKNEIVMIKAMTFSDISYYETKNQKAESKIKQ
jgi:hypothetical protein